MKRKFDPPIFIGDGLLLSDEVATERAHDAVVECTRIINRKNDRQMLYSVLASMRFSMKHCNGKSDWGAFIHQLEDHLGEPHSLPTSSGEGQP